MVPQALLRRGATGSSAFIGPDGEWRAAWLPPRIAAWPFGVMRTPAGEFALAVDEQSGLVTDGGDGIAFFEAVPGEKPKLGLETQRMARMLRAHVSGMATTLEATAALDGEGLFVPLEADDSLLILDLEAAEDIDEDALIRIYRAGALGLLHAAHVSYTHLSWMARAERHLGVGDSGLSAPTKPLPEPSGFLSALSDAFISKEPAFRLP